MLIEIPCPELYLIQDSSMGSLQTSFTVTMMVFSCLHTGESIEDVCLSC